MNSGIYDRGETFVDRCNRLRMRTLEDGWKGPLSRSVAWETWEKALDLVKSVGSEPKFLIPREDGTIFMTWSDNVLVRALDKESGFELDMYNVQFSGFTSYKAEKTEILGIFSRFLKECA